MLDQPITPTLPHDFVPHSDGIARLTENGDTVLICGPITLVALGRSADGASWTKNFEFRDRDGEIKQIRLPIEDLSVHSGKAVTRLTQQGFWIAHGETAAVTKLLNTWDTSQREELHKRNGWLGADYRCYALVDGTTLGTRGRVSLAPPDKGRATSGDSIEAWKEHVAKRAIGNPLAILNISYALAAPLLRLLEIGGGGFHLHGVSSCGKTTLLNSANSVWGSPAFQKSWLSTSNAFESTARARNDGLLTLDEIGEANAASLAQTAYTLANGIPKSRMTTTGGLKEQEEWRVAVLSTGELTLADHLGSAGQNSMNGMHVRLVDVRADKRAHGAFDNLHGNEDSAAFANTLRDACCRHHGYAGPTFVEHLLAERADEWRNKFESFRATWNRTVSAELGAMAQRVADRFAVAAFAGEVASNRAITGWPKGTALFACAELFREWLLAHAQQDVPKVQQYLARVQGYLEDPAAMGLVRVGSNATANAGWWDDEYIYLLSPEFRSAIGTGHEDAASLLKQDGYLKTNSGACQYKLPKSAAPKRPWVYAIKRQAHTSGASD